MKEFLLELRRRHKLSQSEMAEKLFVTRQAVSRWECGETIPNIDTLKLIAENFSVSIDELLGVSHQNICQSCGMPLTDEALRAAEPDGSLSAKYCRWCYADGQFVSDCTMEEMIEHCVPLMHWDDADQCRTYLKNLLSTLERWQ